MDFGFTDDQRDIQRTARDLLAERAKPERVREHAEAATTDDALWSELSELGWPGIAVSEEYGGQGLGQIELSILCEELGRVLAPVPFLPSAMAATVIEQDGSDEQRERLLPGLASGEVIGALGTSVDGTAELVIGGADAALIVLIEPDGSGRVVTAEQVEVTPCRSDRPDPLGRQCERRRRCRRALGDGACAGLGRALVSVSAEMVGVCDRALGMTVEYVKDRKQFGVPVGAYQAVSHRCAQMLLETEKARSATAFAGWTADADPERLAEAAAMAKAMRLGAAREVTASASRPTAGSASPGRPTSTGSTSALRSTRPCWAAPNATVRSSPLSWRAVSVPQRSPEGGARQSRSCA